MADNNTTIQWTNKDTASIAVGAAKAGADSSIESFTKWAADNYQNVDTRAIKGYMLGKSALIDGAFAIDSSKSLDVNIARAMGAIGTGVVIGAVAPGAISAFVIGVVVTVTLKYAGLDPADVAERVYLAADKYTKSYDTFQALTPEQQAAWIKAGGQPWTYGVSFNGISISSSATINKNGTQTNFFDAVVNAGEEFLHDVGDFFENLYYDVKDLFSSEDVKGTVTVGEITIVSDGYILKGDTGWQVFYIFEKNGIWQLVRIEDWSI